MIKTISSHALLKAKVLPQTALPHASQEDIQEWQTMPIQAAELFFIHLSFILVIGTPENSLMPFPSS